MKKSNLRRVLDRIITGKASKKEINLLDKYIYYSQKKDLEVGEVSKGTIWEKVKIQTFEKPVRVFSIAPIWRVAASIAILMGVFWGIYLTQLSAEVNYLTKSTGKGHKTTVTLSDGTIVQLNAESSISYPDSFADLNTRNIELVGEAYFNVISNPNKPFTVKTGEVITKVLGTSFNVSAFAESENITVTVESGRVSVLPVSHERNSYLVVPVLQSGDQINYRKSDLTYHVAKVDPQSYIGWKDGVIHIPDLSFSDAAKILERWYDVEIIFMNSALTQCRIKGKFQSTSLKNVMESIKYFIDFEYEINENQILVNGSGCDNKNMNN